MYQPLSFLYIFDTYLIHGLVETPTAYMGVLYGFDGRFDARVINKYRGSQIENNSMPNRSKLVCEFLRGLREKAIAYIPNCTFK